MNVNRKNYNYIKAELKASPFNLYDCTYAFVQACHDCKFPVSVAISFLMSLHSKQARLIRSDVDSFITAINDEYIYADDAHYINRDLLAESFNAFCYFR